MKTAICFDCMSVIEDPPYSESLGIYGCSTCHHGDDLEPLSTASLAHLRAMAKDMNDPRRDQAIDLLHSMVEESWHIPEVA